MATAYAWIGVQRDGILRSRDFSTDITSAERVSVTVQLRFERGSTPRGAGPETERNWYRRVLRNRAVRRQRYHFGFNARGEATTHRGWIERQTVTIIRRRFVQVADCPPASTDSVTAINHAAVIVGWGMDEAAKKPYWLIKNSYGVDWGEDGYARIAMELTEGAPTAPAVYTPSKTTR